MLQSGRNGIVLVRGKTISTSSRSPQSAAYIIGIFPCCIVKIKMKEVIQSHMKNEMIKAIQGLFFYKKKYEIEISCIHPSGSPQYCEANRVDI